MLTINRNPSILLLRQFGALLLLVLAFFAYRFRLVLPGPWVWLLPGIGVVAFLVSLIHPQVLRGLYVGLCLFVWPLGWVVSYSCLALLFFGVFTPLGWLLRKFGRDPMQRTFEPNRDSYWTPKPKAHGLGSYFRQY